MRQVRGEGKIPAGNGGQVICDGCGGHLGPISSLALLEAKGNGLLQPAENGSRVTR